MFEFRELLPLISGLFHEPRQAFLGPVLLFIPLHHVAKVEAVANLISLACFEVFSTLLDDELELEGDLDRACKDALLHLSVCSQGRVFVPGSLQDLHQSHLRDEHLAPLMDVLQVLQVCKHLFFFCPDAVPLDQLELSLLKRLVLNLLAPFFDLLLAFEFLQGVDALQLALLDGLLVDTLTHLLLLFDLFKLLHKVIILPRLRNKLRYHVVNVLFDLATGGFLSRSCIALVVVLVTLGVLVVLTVLRLTFPILGIKDVLLREEQLQISLAPNRGRHLDKKILPCEEPLVARRHYRKTQGVVEMAVAVGLFRLWVGERVKHMQVLLWLFLRFIRLYRRSHQVLVLELLESALFVGNDEFERGEKLASLNFEQFEGAFNDVKFGWMPVVPLDQLMLHTA